MRAIAAAAFLLALVISSASVVRAQTHTPWEQHDGLEVTEANPLGLVAFTCAPPTHGDVCEYEDEDIPPEDDTGWIPAPNEDTIDYSVYPSRVCEAPIDCFFAGDFTYFQTFVDVPADVVSIMKIDFKGIDDGTRVTIFNSSYPDGFALPERNVLDGFGTADLSGLLVSGEVNRVVITHVDDCCSEADLRQAVVTLGPAADSDAGAGQ